MFGTLRGVRAVRRPPHPRADMTPDDFQTRKRAKVELVSEFGGDEARLRLAALAAISRGLYSPKTVLGDIEAALERAWRGWKRSARAQKRAAQAAMEEPAPDEIHVECLTTAQ